MSISVLTNLTQNPKRVLIVIAALFTVHALSLALEITTLLLPSNSATLQAAHVVYSVALLLIIAGIPRSTLSIKEKLFWFCITVAMALWLLTKFSMLLLLSFELSDWLYLLADYGYFAFFLVVALAHIFFSHQDKRTHKLHISTLAQLTAITFMGGLFVYLIVVPSQASATEFNQHYSSFLFFILMDLYLLIAFFISARTEEELPWRQRFFWFAASFLLFLLLDLTELLIKADVFNLTIDGIFALFWYLPYCTLACALSPPATTSSWLTTPKVVPAYLPDNVTIAFILLPILHISGHYSGFFSAELQPLRESILVLWILAFSLLNYLKNLQNRPASREIEQPVIDVKTPQEAKNPTEHFPFPCFILDKLGKIKHCNAAAANKFQYTQESLSGTFFSGLLAKEEPLENLLRFSESSFSESRLITHGIREAFFQDRQGKQLTCYVAFREMEDNEFVASLVDISRLHEAEEQALSIKDKFLANITHEFRTPLTIIQGALEEGIEQIQEDKLNSRMVAAKTNAIRILKMVEQLLNLSKITSAPKLDKSLQPVSQIIADTCQQFEQLCINKSIQFEHSIQPGLWTEVHDDSLQQILYNLLSNAYKYSTSGSLMSVNTEFENDLLRLTLTDTGCGMTEEEQTRLFERFQRADSAKRSETFGVGIGLSLVSELVAVHEWRISVESELNKGTTFVLEMPCQYDPNSAVVEANSEYQSTVFNGEIQQNPPATALDDNPAANTGDNRLLIIEDNADMQDYLRHLMSPLYHTEIITNGRPGIERAVDEIPDVIICDLMLPDISGFEVVTELKANPLTQHIPILMLTAKSDTQSKLQGLERQADDYLTKPFHHKELQLRINNLLQNRARMQALLRRQLHNDSFTQAKAQCLPEEMQTAEVLPYQQFLDKLQLVAAEHYHDEEFTASLLASELAMSERQLQRKLKAALNMTPGEYLREYRILKSRELLAQGMAIGLVSDAVGFSNQNYFTRCFKQQCGVTPSEYQKNVATPQQTNQD